MKRAKLKSGMSLPEILTSIMIVALLVTLSMPAVKAIYNSFSSTGSAEVMINAALSNARAIAMSQQKYAGVRFQKAYNSKSVNASSAEQYMIFIIQDRTLTGTYGYGFKAVEGMQPIKLPDNTTVMDMFLVASHNQNNPINPSSQLSIGPANQIASEKDLLDTTSFSIIFSPQGNLVIHGVRMRQAAPADDVFNINTSVDGGTGMFYQDDYFDGTSPDLGLGPEPSRRTFVICEQNKFKKAYDSGTAWTGYLNQLKPVYINSYTGTIISAGQ
jgi:hypothetical protein